MNFSISIDKDLIISQKKEVVREIFNQISSDYVFEKNDKGDWIIWIGDFVLPEDYDSIQSLIKSNLQNFNLNDILRTGGFFYCLQFLSEKKTLNIFTGFLNILPIYFYENDTTYFISSSPKYIVDYSQDKFEVSNRFIVEKLLFNYSYGNNSIYEKINMLKGNHYLQLKKDGIKQICHTNILDFIVADPLPVKKSIKHLTELFESRIKSYLPNEEYYISFTGGFDGRTLLSESLSNEKKLIAYSFGTKTSEDITIPMKQAQELNIDFQPFYLDNPSYLDHSLDLGLKLVDISDGQANLSRAHYVYAAEEISKTHKYIITGNFGSEIFRAFRGTGVMVSPFLYHLFNSPNLEEFLDNYHYNELKSLNPEVVRQVLPGLKNDLLLDDNLKRSSIYSINQRFYKFAFEDIFRKYFGSEIVMQSQFLFNRAPFLDYQFIKELLKTKLAGVYSDFYEQNPVKRMKGQLLYANIIRKNSSQLYWMKTGKGYRPADLVLPYGRLILAANLFRKKFSKKIMDENGVKKAFQDNRSKIESIKYFDNIFLSSEYIKAIKGEAENLNTSSNIISLNWYLSKHFNNND